MNPTIPRRRFLLGLVSLAALAAPVAAEARRKSSGGKHAHHAGSRKPQKSNSQGCGARGGSGHRRLRDGRC